VLRDLTPAPRVAVLRHHLQQGQHTRLGERALAQRMRSCNGF
jgi:hypothetical protein